MSAGFRRRRLQVSRHNPLQENKLVPYFRLPDISFVYPYQ